MSPTKRSSFGVPGHALPAHNALLNAIHEAGATPCSRNPELWYHEAAVARARAADACLDCPVFAACSEYATTAGEREGVWAGVDTQPTLGRRKKVA